MPQDELAVTVAALGELELRRDGVTVELGPQQQRVFLAILALQDGRPIGRDALIERMWGEEPPKTAVGLVHRHATDVRRILEPERVSRTAGGVLSSANAAYRLMLDSSDVAEFEAGIADAAGLRARGLAREAAEVLHAALALWRGPLCHGLSSPFLESERERLAEQRLTAQADRIDLDLELGSPADLVGELRALVARHPTRERLHGALMRALVREGRRQDALDVFRSLYRQLRDDGLGAPSTAVRQIQQRILDDDPQLVPPVRNEAAAAPPGPSAPLAPTRPTGPTARPTSPAAPPVPGPAPASVPVTLPHALAGFVGREEELAALDRALAEGAGGQEPPIATIAGTAGVGKSTLALRWAHSVRDRFPGGQVFLDLCGYHPHSAPVEPEAAVRALLRALGVAAEQLPPDPEAQAGLYQRLLGERRVLVLLDNARDSAQVRPLLPGSGGSLVLVTSRDQLVGLVAVDGARPVPLPLLTDAGARLLLARRIGADRVAAEPAAVGRIAAACAHLPLALAVVGARAGTNPGFSLEQLADELDRAQGALDPFDGGDGGLDVRAVFSWSLAGLDEADARLFRMLGLAPGAEVSAAAAGSLTGRPAAATGRQLARLSRANLLSERSPGRFGMHDLLRAYAQELAEEEDDSDARDAALRRLLDHYLHTAHGADRLVTEFRDDPIELEAPTPGAVVRQLRGRRDAEHWFSDELPVLHEAIRRAAAAAFDEHAWRLAWSLVHVLDRRGDWHQAAELQEIALGAAGRLGRPQARAVCHTGMAYALVRLGRTEEAGLHLQRSLELYERTQDTLGKAHAHRTLTWVLDRRGEFEEGLHHSQQALELFRAAGHPAGEARALNGVGWFHSMLGDHTTALRRCRQALELQQLIGARFDSADTLDSIGRASQRLGRFEDAADHYERACAIYREFGDRYNEADELAALGDVRLQAGDQAAAHAAWHDALGILDELRHPDAVAVRARLRDS